MTNPTLERAARAAYDHPASFSQGCWVDPPEHLDLASVVVDGDVNLIEIARAVLMAVRTLDLPSWAHFEQEAWRDGIDAILNDGEANG